MAANTLDQATIDSALGPLHDDWSGTPDGLHRKIAFADFPTAAEFVVRLAPRCEEMNHHPDLAISWRNVEITLVTHDTGGVTDSDTKLAAIIDEVADTLPLAD